MSSLDRFSRPLHGEILRRELSEDEIADYKAQEDERRIERLERHEASEKLIRESDPTY